MLIKKMLTYNPDDRVSAEEALNDVWVQENTIEKKKELKEPILDGILNNLSKIHIE